MTTKCIVFDCTNKKGEGKFVGDICKPCHVYITTGKIELTTSFLGKMDRRLRHLENLIKIYESDD